VVQTSLPIIEAMASAMSPRSFFVGSSPRGWSAAVKVAAAKSSLRIAPQTAWPRTTTGLFKTITRGTWAGMSTWARLLILPPSKL